MNKYIYLIINERKEGRIYRSGLEASIELKSDIILLSHKR
jgi:hypothetical protein